MGRYWYYDGKLLSKNHTFDDTAAAARFLIQARRLHLLAGRGRPTSSMQHRNRWPAGVLQARYTSSDRMALWGRSAGGLTVGATINRHPELFKARRGASPRVARGTAITVAAVLAGGDC